MSGESVYDLVDGEPVTVPETAEVKAKTSVKRGNRAPPPTGTTFGLQGTSAIVGNLGGEYTSSSVHPVRKAIGGIGRDVSSTIHPKKYLRKNEGQPVPSRGISNVDQMEFKISDWHREKVKPDLPKDTPIYGLCMNKNYVVANPVENILAIPTKCIPPPEPRPTESKDFGKVPEYLTELKQDIEQRRAVMSVYHKQLRAAGELWSKLSLEELEEMRIGLQKRWDVLNKEYQSKGFVMMKTPSQQSHQAEIERELNALEFAMQKISRNNIFVFNDQK